MSAAWFMAGAAGGLVVTVTQFAVARATEALRLRKHRAGKTEQVACSKLAEPQRKTCSAPTDSDGRQPFTVQRATDGAAPVASGPDLAAHEVAETATRRVFRAGQVSSFADQLAHGDAVLRDRLRVFERGARWDS